MELGGIHHITAVSGDARKNLDFYTRILGLRLVKKTVNQDVINTYHLFYGDEVGSPGTEMTFFEWPNAGPHQPGSGDVSAIAFVAPVGSLAWWSKRLDSFGVPHNAVEERDGRATLALRDPEGQRLELVEGERDDVTPWSKGPVPEQYALHGFAGVRLTVSELEPTSRLLTDLLHFRQTREYTSPDTGRRVVVFETGEGGIGTEVHLQEDSTMPGAHVGIGGVHHVAFRTPNDEHHAAWQRELARAGVQVTPVIDRYYFRALYFREPGGVLFEISTDGPGFATDEDITELGQHLSLPPFLEPRRAYIESKLHPLDVETPTTAHAG